MLREIHSHLDAVNHSISLASATVTPTNGVDIKGFSAIEFVIAIGAVANIANSPQPSWAFKLQESDSESSGFTDVTDSNKVVVGSALSPVAAPDSSTGVFLTVDDAAEDDKVYRIGYIGTKRYVRVVATAANTPGNTPLAIIALRGHAHQQPTQDT